MAESPMQTKLRELGDTRRKHVEQALKDALTGRKALMRAYETISERLRDSEAKTMLRRFADEERQEFEQGKRVLERYGIDTGVAEGVKNEVVAFLSRMVVRGGGEGAYADVRDLTMLYGAEQAAKLAAAPMEDVAEMLGDREWKEMAERSEERAEHHADYLEGRVEEMAREAFGVGGR